MRLFVAVPVPLAIANAVFATLPSGLPGLRRVKPEQLHLTLAFLGETTDEHRAGAERACAAAVAGRMPFPLALDWVGTFGSSQTTTLWLGVGEGADALNRLAKTVRDGLDAEGVRYDRKPFAAHVTVAKLRSARDGSGRRAATAVARSLELPPLRFPAGRVELVQSRLSAKGAQYAAVGNYPFAGPPARIAEPGGLHFDL